MGTVASKAKEVAESTTNKIVSGVSKTTVFVKDVGVGAAKGVWNVAESFPGVGHGISLGFKVCGYKEKASEILNKANNGSMGMAEACPGLGHYIAFKHK